MKSLSDNSFHGNYNGGGFILSYGGEDVPKGEGFESTIGVKG